MVKKPLFLLAENIPAGGSRRLRAREGAQMRRDLKRLLRPRSIAVIGGGAWCANVVEQCRKMGFDGTIWPVHPTRDTLADVPAFAGIEDVPGVPDAAFIGVNRHATVEIVRHLAGIGAGGAVCFASGFREAQAETGDGAGLQEALLQAAGGMPILGPNCYGMINYLDGALLWPDQHGGQRCDRGVAIVTQSSNIAINLTMQARGLPIAYVVTAGNQAQTGLADLGRALLADDRVSALGLHIEGIGDLRAFEALAAEARARGKPIVALKAGRSDHARAAAVSHTASMAGSDAGGRALLDRLGIARVASLPALLETLKLVHFAGPLRSNRIASMSCSGGEASLVADSAEGRDIVLPPLSARQRDGLRAALGPKVALANPLDYHTYIWGDTAAMARAFAAMLSGDLGLGCLIVDFPRTDRCSMAAWDCAIEASRLAAGGSTTPLALIATLPEGMSEPVAQRCIDAGLIPLLGLDDALSAIEAAAFLGEARRDPAPLLLPGTPAALRTLSEAEAKAELAGHGLAVPRAERATQAGALAAAAHRIGAPLVIKAEGLAHKSDMGGVVLAPDDPQAALAAARRMPCDSWLVEEMVTGAVAELLIGVLRDPAHGFVLTLAAGGTLTEIIADSTQLLLPVEAQDIDAALDTLRIARLLEGYRGKPAADREAIVRAVLAVQDYVIAQAHRLEEVEINPLICTPDRAVAVDALITIGEPT
ncbi:Acyl-CoA synthetase (NDP forming) [Roseovarius litoreus]|uniref:Acyl-CoA synthetase (NDP forming) n=2 Tax=Roseovarius litoreus TaxID=1155722 RepID=A0A1M6ZNK1_9RHOB|nr:Acyl-CoA synthetase (NDP forming) [Roseovarius litoreus]